MTCQTVASSTCTALGEVAVLAARQAPWPSSSRVHGQLTLTSGCTAQGVAINFCTAQDNATLRDIEQYYSTQASTQARQDAENCGPRLFSPCR